MKARTLVSIALALALLMAMGPTVAFAADDSTGGSFTVANEAPSVGTIQISPGSMTPQEEWTQITVPVTDNNTLADVDEVHVEVFYDSAGTDPAAPGSANVQTCGILTWTRGGSPEWNIAPASTTWAINSGSCTKATDTLSTGNWVFSFKVGKVATESPGTDDWDIYAKATDGSAATGDDYLRDIEMNWYGEITVNTGSVDWGSVSLGLAFAEGNPSEEGGISVTYIANGAYDEEISALSPWDGPGTESIALNAGGSPGDGEFSLKADEDGTLASAVLVTVYNTYALLDDDGTQTDESGDTIATNSIFLALGSTGIPAVQYSGTIYYKIDDGS